LYKTLCGLLADRAKGDGERGFYILQDTSKYNVSLRQQQEGEEQEAGSFITQHGMKM
jgi:hypothetical protein